MSEKEIKKVSPEMDRMKEKGKKTNRASVESQAGREMTTGEGGGGGASFYWKEFVYFPSLSCGFCWYPTTARVVAKKSSEECISACVMWQILIYLISEEKNGPPFLRLTTDVP